MSARKTRERQAAAASEEAGRPLVWPGDPEGVTAADIDFDALAHVLANTCRFGGRTAQYHSLAAHAVVASEEIEALDGLDAEARRTLALHALIAGAPEAWLRGGHAGSQRAAERTGRLAARIERAVREAAGLDAALGEDHAELLRFVSRMTAAAERRDFPDADLSTGGGVAFPPLKRRVKSIDPGRAAQAWLARFRALSGPPRGAGAGTGPATTQSEGESGDDTRAQTTQATERSGGDARRQAA